jgi:fatty acid desaturase
VTSTLSERRPTAGSDFAVLSRRITDAGLLDRRPGYYAVRLTTVAVALAAGWTAFVLVGASWWQLAVAVYLAIVFAQLALVAHDLAHRQVFRTRGRSEVAGLVAGNVGIGMSYGWWMDKHTRHHANPNHTDLDPDVAPELLVWSTDQARGRRGLVGFVNAYQAYLFFPLLTLLGLGLRKGSVQAVARGTIRGTMRRRGLEGVLLAVHFLGYLAALLVVLTPLQALAFFAVHQGLFGVYLGCTFAPNHKGMPTPDDSLDFLRKQVLTSRNVAGGPLVDVVLGGLNYQIEHHLFPSMPTPNLRRAQPIVREFCAEIGVEYTETGLFASYGEALRHLHASGAPLRGSRG